MSGTEKHLDMPEAEKEPSLNRADEVSTLVNAVKDLLVPFIRAADEDAEAKGTGHGLKIKGGGPRTTLVEHHKPQKLEQLLNLQLPDDGKGQDGLLTVVKAILQYSVNTWDQGFLDKLYASTNAVGVVSELILAVLNTNVHVFATSPALTIIEKTTTKTLANLFGLNGPHAGGISVQGGSASNTTSIVVARNTKFPETKEQGNSASGLKLILFTSAHGHYSIEKAAQMLGFGSSAVWPIPVDSQGHMIPSALDTRIQEAKSQGFTPFYLNATAGTTVLGSFDPFPALAEICHAHNLWFHIDASWGGPAIFSLTYAHKLKGSELANSIAINPHKMMGVPITCSFLLGADMRQFHTANTLPASYLFHNDSPGGHGRLGNVEIYDLADLTLQCGRRGDALKLALGWIYYGGSGYSAQITRAFEIAAHLSSLIAFSKNFVPVTPNPPECLQVCFYYAPDGELCPEAEGNSTVTKGISEVLVREGFMVDYAPGENGMFFRVVVNRDTRRETCDGLVKSIEKAGKERVKNLHADLGNEK
ncbi:MAG: hypothetical protein MMC33_004991 [Icmadophila ericetorum]|nr:hypothetical protein [Icmadophila ericetorum]